MHVRLFESYVFVPKRSRTTQLPCWLTSLIVPLMTRSNHLSQSPILSPLLHTPFPIKLCTWISTAASPFGHSCAPSQKPHFVWGLFKVSRVFLKCLHSSSVVQRRSHWHKGSLVIEFYEIWTLGASILGMGDGLCSGAGPSSDSIPAPCPPTPTCQEFDKLTPGLPTHSWVLDISQPVSPFKQSCVF